MFFKGNLIVNRLKNNPPVNGMFDRRRNDRTQLIGEDDLQDTSSPPQQGAGGYGTVSVPLGRSFSN